jgi:SAM-dependent methyltransferase
MSPTWPPTTPIVPDVAAALPFLNRAIACSHDVALNVEGGDVGGLGSSLLVARHVANYQAAADAVAALGVLEGPVLDVGCGVGALSAWVADRLGLDLVLCDRDEQVVRFGAQTFAVPAETDLSRAPRAAIVLAMEVLEHVPPAEQAGFLQALWDRVAPGGLLVLSTPDETSYPGGWSGYAPHVGCVSPRRLHQLLVDATGTEPGVYRLDGGPYAMPLSRRVLERVANGAWTTLQRRTPRLALSLASRSSRAEALDLDAVRPAATPFAVVDPAHGTGTGLLAVVRRPSRD